MRARTCDVCKKLYEHYEGSKLFKDSKRSNAIILIDRDLENKYWSRETIDLCPDCMSRIEYFLINEDGEQDE